MLEFGTVNYICMVSSLVIGVVGFVVHELFPLIMNKRIPVELYLLTRRGDEVTVMNIHNIRIFPARLMEYLPSTVNIGSRMKLFVNSDQQDILYTSPQVKTSLFRPLSSALIVISIFIFFFGVLFPFVQRYSIIHSLLRSTPVARVTLSKAEIQPSSVGS